MGPRHVLHASDRRDDELIRCQHQFGPKPLVRFWVASATGAGRRSRSSRKRFAEGGSADAVSQLSVEAISVASSFGVSRT